MGVNLITTMCNEHNKLYKRCKKDTKKADFIDEIGFPFVTYFPNLCFAR